MKFSTQKVEEPVEIDGKQYVLREANESAKVKWQDFLIGKATMVDGKPASMGSISGASAVLVSECLFVWPEEAGPYTAGSKRKLPNVPLSTINDWPARVVDELHAWIMEHSDLVPKSKDTEEGLNRQLAEVASRLDTIRKAKAASGGPEGNGVTASQIQQTPTTMDSFP